MYIFSSLQKIKILTVWLSFKISGYKIASKQEASVISKWTFCSSFWTNWVVLPPAPSKGRGVETGFNGKTTMVLSCLLLDYSTTIFLTV
jgi:hypothetical protein